MIHDINDRLEETHRFLTSRIAILPEIAIVLGSGLGVLAERIESPVVIPYAEIPHFVTSTVEGHAGTLIAGRFQGKALLCLNGRCHYYEGYSFADIT